MARDWQPLGRLLSIVVTAALVTLLTAVPARGHAVFTGSEPGADEVLEEPPTEVVLHFSDLVQDDISDVTVTAPDGERFTDALNQATVIRVHLNTDAEGTYTVEWRTTSSQDGHTVQGSFEFTVDRAPRGDEGDGRPDDAEDTPAPPVPGTDEADDAEVGDQPDDLERRRRASAVSFWIGLGRTLEYLGWLTVMGWLTLGGLARRAGLGWAPNGVAPWVVVAVVGAAAAVTGELVRIGGGDLVQGAQAFLPTSGGRARLLRLAAGGVAATTAFLVSRGARRDASHRRARVSLALMAVVALTAIAASGHAASKVGYLLAGAGHLIAAGVWAGTPVAMVVHRPSGGWRGEAGRRVLRAYAPIALAAFAGTVLLGSVRAVQELTRASDLWTTTYGRILSGKVLVVAAMVPFSLLAWRGSRPHLRIEGSLAVAVVVLAAALAVSTPPTGAAEGPTTDPPPPTSQDAPTSPEAPPAPEAPDSDGSGPLGAGRPTNGDLTMAQGAGTTVVGLTVRPGHPGENEVFVTTVPAAGLDAADALDVSLAAAGRGVLPLRRCGEACHSTTLSLEGGEHLRVDVLEGDEGEMTTFTLPDLPAPDAAAVFARADERMRRLSSFRYDEVFGPHEPPTLSTWEIVAPDRLRGVITRGDDDHNETVRIGGRRWRRDGPNGTWEGGEDTGPAVRANRFVWGDQEAVAPKVIGQAEIEGVVTREVSLFTQERDLPIWYRLWIDDEHLVRQVEMRTQGHFMDQRFYDFDTAIEIRPPN